MGMLRGEMKASLFGGSLCRIARSDIVMAINRPVNISVIKYVCESAKLYFCRAGTNYLC
jgi:hypothetical protein